MDSAGELLDRLGAQPIACPVIPKSVRILMLSIVNPQRERNGAATVTRGLIEALELPPLRAQVECIPVRTEPHRWPRLAQARSLIGSLVSGIPAKAGFLRSHQFREKVGARIQSEHYDLLVLNGSDLLWISKYLPVSIPQILVAHNIEHLLFSTQIQNLGWAYQPLKALLRTDCKRLQDFEWNGMRKTANAIFLSHEDAAYAARFCQSLQSTTIPPLFDYRPWHRRRREAGTILEIGYLGNFRWWPNRLGLQWFATKVLPHVKCPMRLNLYGYGSGSVWHGDGRIVGHGVVEELERVWETCDFLICPSFSNAGVCVKLTEAIYNGVPVLATTDAARGLSLGNDPALVLLDKPEEWVEFLHSGDARDLVGRQVSKKLAVRFAIDSHKDTLQQFVLDAISRRAACGATV